MKDLGEYTKDRWEKLRAAHGENLRLIDNGIGQKMTIGVIIRREE